MGEKYNKLIILLFLIKVKFTIGKIKSLSETTIVKLTIRIFCKRKLKKLLRQTC